MFNATFKPSSMDKCLEKVCRTQLPDILICIKKRIGTDWPELKYVVCATEEDLIEIKIELNDEVVLPSLMVYIRNVLSLIHI